MDAADGAALIKWNRASFAVYGGRRSASEISELLNLEPDMHGDVGELTPAGHAGRKLKPQYLTYQRTYWSIDVDSDSHRVDAEDETGFAALTALVGLLTPRAEALVELRKDAETVLWWSGDSDSTQGGFVLTADLIGQLALLGCDIRGTAYISVEESEVARSD
ncbi:hypothetical protein [Microbacterium natoriense]|uniref:hypothetical protein n=1 Tax=Microbacterium natoriense TaxID=284570 RepID=UPI0031DD9E16